MEIKILAVTHSNFSHLYHKALKLIKLPLTLDILEVSFGEIEKLDQALLEQYDLMITSGAHLEMITENHPAISQIIPIYPIHFSEADLIKGLVNAKKSGTKVMIMYFPQMEYDLKKYAQLLEIDLVVLKFKDLEEAENLMEQYDARGYNVIVGTSSICEIAQRKGINHILIYSIDTLKAEIIKAYQYANSTNRVRTLSGINDALYEHVTDPIILLNKNLEVTAINRSALKFLGITNKSLIIEQPITKYLDVKFAQEKNETQVILKTNFEIIIEPMDFTKKYYLLIINRFENSQKKKSIDFNSKYQFTHIIHHSKAMEKIILQTKQYAMSDATVLIRGDSGTGKELIAHSIHKHSSRRLKPFITVNCSAIPANILESEFFGYEDGAFTGARKGGKLGLFELAQNGTLFLDEVGELPIELQAKLLRVLQEKEVVRLGGHRVISLDVRIISATNQNLKELIKEKKFREDLFYRLNVLHIKLPSLMERKEDIPILFHHLLIKHGLSEQRADHLLSQVNEVLLSYEWPGNIRELENIAQRVCALNVMDENAMYLEQTFFDLFNESVLDTEVTHHKKDTRETKEQSILNEAIHFNRFEIEKKQLMEALVKYNGNKTLICEHLNLSRTTLWRKLKKHKLDYSETK